MTGANFLLETDTTKLLVDCGSREGIDARNAPQPFPYDPKEIGTLLVTHAHQDHIGRIPELVRAGFRGAIWSTAATRDLAAIMFDDAFGIMEREAAHTRLPLAYERADIAQALMLWRTHEYHESFALGDVHVEMLDAGHILGSAMFKVSRNGRAILFTGDIGNAPEPLLNDPERPTGVQYLVMESVYGDRLHEGRSDRTARLGALIEETRARNGTLLIPSFSLERTQVLLAEMNDMVERGEMRPRLGP